MCWLFLFVSLILIVAYRMDLAQMMEHKAENVIRDENIVRIMEDRPKLYLEEEVHNAAKLTMKEVFDFRKTKFEDFFPELKQYLKE